MDAKWVPVVNKTLSLALWRVFWSHKVIRIKNSPMMAPTNFHLRPTWGKKFSGVHRPLEAVRLNIAEGTPTWVRLMSGMTWPKSVQVVRRLLFTQQRFFQFRGSRLWVQQVTAQQAQQQQDSPNPSPIPQLISRTSLACGSRWGYETSPESRTKARHELEKLLAGVGQPQVVHWLQQGTGTKASFLEHVP